MPCGSTTCLSTVSFVPTREPSRAAGFNSVIRWITIAKQMYLRRRQRQALLQLEDHQLADIGLTRERAELEGHKPFWK
jgi:uncharacterized protein YjiS (DUF1127 family)